ncbi:ComEC/Rec2 family competence protein [Lysinibacter sp. HNR]|uniref:ComEC/Rec2 family competence protein n=1 Tax=Lysinibacter sp. HNR TaxID=3031408 RepID=UPI0024354978|nr:ComEC/Rec2 family competence protein [Lysinibacter sp. HNR]WGD36413.1 ComEC/Rec2 family competence protein [Lysinibacter sp. HNR]
MFLFDKQASKPQNEVKHTGELHPRGAVGARGELDLRLAIPAACVWVAGFILITQPRYAGFVAVGCFLCAFLLILLFTVVSRSSRGWPGYRGRLSGVPQAVLSLTVVALVAFRIGGESDLRVPEALLDAAQTRQTVLAMLEVTSDPTTTQTGFGEEQRVFAVMTSAILAPSAPGTTGRDKTLDTKTVISMRSPVVVLGEREDLSPAHIGSRMVAQVTLRATESGEQRAFIATLGAQAPRHLPASPFLGTMNTLRDGLSDFAETLPGVGGELLPGLAIGQTGLVSEELNRQMKESSLSHLTAVSGSNCAVVTGILVALSSRVGFLRRGRSLIATGGLVLFVVLVTPDPSVLRAACMSLVVMASMLSGRPGRGIAALSCAVIVLLVADPWMSRNYGFALSVFATGGILLLAPALAERLARAVPGWCALAVAVPVAAQLACQPILILLQPEISLIGVVANIVAAPAAPAATVLGLVACLLLPVVGWLGQMIGWVAWWPSAWIGHVARVSSELPAARIAWVDGAWGAALAALAIIGALCGLLILSRHPAQRAKKAPRIGGAIKELSHRTVAAVMFVLSGVISGFSIGAVNVSDWIDLATRPSEWAYAMCDVGQGDGFLVRSEEHTIMIDVGPDPAAATECLHLLGVDRIDLLVLTHSDLDHVGGLNGVMSRVQTAIVSPPREAREQAIFTKLESAGIKTTRGLAGMSGSIGNAQWSILGPHEPDTREERGINTNDRSVILEITLSPPGRQQSRAVFLGDLGERAQQKLLARVEGELSSIDVVKVAHHGSGDQYDALYQKISARFALVSVGAENSYGHPAKSILETLRQSGTRVFRSDTMGTVALTPPSNKRSTDTSGMSQGQRGVWDVWQRGVPPSE